MSDPRLTPARPDLAARRLEGTVEAARFADPVTMQVVVSIAPLTRRPDPAAGLDTELLHGELFEVYEIAGGVAWGQAPRDGYVGYVPEVALAPPGPAPTHRIGALRSHVYPAPDFKTRPLGWLPYGAPVAVTGTEGRFAALAHGGFVPLPHIAPLDRPADDWVAEAERFLGTPYLWGGRSSAGCDCSSLVQLAMQAADLECPRDSDMQEAALGETIGGNVALRRGDLVFWKGHVGLMLDDARLLHANAFHMAVAIEPLAQAIPRIEGQGDGPVTRRARLDSGSGAA